MPEFDAYLRLDRTQLAGDPDVATLCETVRRAVSGLDGAGSVLVEPATERDTGESEWIVLTPRGKGAMTAGEWAALLARVQGVALVAIAGARLGAVPPPLAASGPPASSGFADAQGYRPRIPAAPENVASPGQSLPEPPPARRRIEDHELLARLLALANPNGDQAPLAEAAVRRFGSFAAVLSAPLRELRATPGLGTHSVAAIKLVQEAALRLARAGVMHRPVLNDWPRLIDYLAAQLGREKIEQFRVLFLDNRDRLLADEAQARGTVNHTPVYPREVVRRALELRAASVILVHNHPSGDPTPSRDDLAMTAQVGEATAILSIALRDHVIVGNGRWVSFRQEGLL